MAPSYSSAAPETKCRHRVVLVDDDDAVRTVLGISLRRLGFEVVAFSQGADALAHVQAEACRFVLTDLFMPDVDGLQLACWLQVHRPGTGVALVSGDEAQARALFRTAGLPEDLPVLCKPFTLDQLEALVKRLVEAPFGALAS